MIRPRPRATASSSSWSSGGPRRDHVTSPSGSWYSWPLAAWRQAASGQLYHDPAVGIMAGQPPAPPAGSWGDGWPLDSSHTTTALIPQRGVIGSPLLGLRPRPRGATAVHLGKGGASKAGPGASKTAPAATPPALSF